MEWDELYSFNNAPHAALATLQLIAVHNIVFHNYLINGKGGG